MKYVCKTNVGNVRKNNEDSALASKELSLIAVADGMGGHNAGEVASQIAIDIIARELGDAADEQRFSNAFARANDIIYEEARKEEARSGMGTTLTCAKIYPDRIIIGHAGDSSAYLVSDGRITKLTIDHTYVQQLLTSGMISKRQAAEHPQRNLLINCVGYDKGFFADVFTREWKAGDKLIICSDGLSDCVRTEELQRIIQKQSDIALAASELIELALKRGGWDNITVSIAENDGEAAE